MLRNKCFDGCFLLSRFGTFGRWISGDGYGNLSSLVKVGSASSKIALPYCHGCQSNLRPLNLRPSYSWGAAGPASHNAVKDGDAIAHCFTKILAIFSPCWKWEKDGEIQIQVISSGPMLVMDGHGDFGRQPASAYHMPHDKSIHILFPYSCHFTEDRTCDSGTESS